MNDKSNNQQDIQDINNSDTFTTFGDAKTEAVIKRTEKVVSALCLVTNFLSDNDSIKWAVRDKGVSLLSKLFAAAPESLFNRPAVLAQTMSLVNEIISLIEVASLSKLISEMNASIIKKELNALRNSIKDINTPDAPQGFLLSELFSQAEDNRLSLASGQNGVSGQKQFLKDNKDKGHFYKGQNNQTTLVTKRATGYRLKNSAGNNIRKDARKTVIISLFKKNKELTIKDISLAIPDCSGKTIQRELNGMLKDKIIRKEGEKRWSRYYLNRD